MTNMKMAVKDRVLTITINLDEDHGPSKSGKTTIIATSSGAVHVPEIKDAIVVNLNVYKPKK